MDGLHVLLVLLLGLVSYSHGRISEPVLEVTVRPGDNIIVYCDCKTSTGVYIVWYRNCSHENQPTLVLKAQRDSYTEMANNYYQLKFFSRFQMVTNNSSDSYDLLIMNITDSDEGFYYCGTEQKKVEDKEHITERYIHTYGNITTRIRINSSEPDHHKTPQGTSSLRNCGVCWTLLFSLCPTFAFLSSLLSSLVVYHLCSKKAKESQVEQQKTQTGGQSRLNQDEDVCYAALEIRQPSQRPKKKKKKKQETLSSDFSTYSAINTSRM